MSCLYKEMESGRNWLEINRVEVGARKDVKSMSTIAEMKHVCCWRPMGYHCNRPFALHAHGLGQEIAVILV
jgi:hypothetical protein